MKLATRIRQIASEPYRLFFPLGVLAGTAGIGHWLIYGAGWIPKYSTYFHSSFQMLVYMNLFVLGFLLTAMPRFASAAPSGPRETGFFLGGVALIAGFLSAGVWWAAEICYAAILLGLVAFIVKRVRGRGDGGGEPPVEFVWIPFAVLHGVTGALLLAAGQLRALPSWALAVGKPMQEQGFILAVVLGVGGFLAPRLMGRAVVIRPDEVRDAKAVARARLRKVLAHAALAVTLYVTFWLEGFGQKLTAAYMRAAIVTWIFFRNGALPWPPRVPDLFVRLLWVSVWMVWGGAWAAAVIPQYRVAMLHLIFIGGFSLMTFAVGTMVVLSHSGRGMMLRRPLGVLKIVAAGVAFAAALRVAAVFFPSWYFILLAAGSVAWIVSGLAWLIFAAAPLATVPSPDEFEKFHEQAKERVSHGHSC
ncbi:MAG: NnrS family protein [Candidatus Omnitrophica bacterium]|nr:NnrS family protein [Candidatus Omnitrophota bacterium]